MPNRFISLAEVSEIFLQEAEKAGLPKEVLLDYIQTVLGGFPVE